MPILTQRFIRFGLIYMINGVDVPKMSVVSLSRRGTRAHDLCHVNRFIFVNLGCCSFQLTVDKLSNYIYLGRTKNGQPRIVYLNDSAVEAITDWLKSRKDDYDELFLTNKGAPYSRPRNKAGGITKTAYRGARRRAAKILAKLPKDGGWGLPERAKVMLQVTPHWARHNMTSHRLAKGESKEAIKDDLGWSSIEMVERYGHDLAGMGKAHANLVQFKTDTILTRGKIKKLKKARKSN